MNITKISKKDDKCRINAFISKLNYKKINNLISAELIGARSLTKGEIIDLALTNLFNSLECGESIENILINHYEALSESEEDV